MITLYSYPTLFGVADNNGYGLKIFAFLRLAGLPLVHEHIFDASAAPRGQFPCMVDDGAVVGDSEAILAHLKARPGVTLDAALGRAGVPDEPARHPPARRSLLGDFLFTLEGRALLGPSSRPRSSRSTRT